MARGDAARRSARGGEGIQALRKARARIALASLALAAYGGVFAYVVSRDATAAPATGGIGGLGVLVIAYALVRGHEAAIAPALAVQVVGYTIALLVHGNAVDQGAPLVAVALLLAGELAAWSIAERDAITAERAVWSSRAVGVVGLAFGGLAIATLVVALSAAPAGGGLGWTVLGAAATVAAIGLATLLAPKA
jgi:hypothetical protein